MRKNTLKKKMFFSDCITRKGTPKLLGNPDHSEPRNGVWFGSRGGKTLVPVGGAGAERTGVTGSGSPCPAVNCGVAT